MAMKTQGSNLYVIDPEDNSIIEVGCVTSIDGIDSQIEELENTCLSQTVARTFEPGLSNPGTATFDIRTDTSDASHIRLHELKIAGTVLQWALGWSDQPNMAPTVDSDGDFNLQATRSWLRFEGYLSNYPFSFAVNALVSSGIGIRISGEPQLIPTGS